MPSKKKDLSKHNASQVPSAKSMRFALVVSEWNEEITEALFEGAFKTLLKYGASPKNILRYNVPGSFELTLGAQRACKKKPHAVICLGCVIQGETKHFDFICNAVANGLTSLNIKYNIPVIFGVLTTNSMQQAIERTGGERGNKGVEAAVTAIRMAALK
jgi:6,7-dimethyl-8-ribityllumazine synthase